MPGITTGGCCQRNFQIEKEEWSSGGKYPENVKTQRGLDEKLDRQCLITTIAWSAWPILQGW
jgi:hypothetical protein